MTESMPYVPPPQPSELTPEQPPERLPDHRRRWLVPVAAGAAGVAVGALVTAGIMSGGGSGPAAAAIASSTNTPGASPSAAAATGGAKGGKARGVRGVITAENGSTWTVRSQAGPTLTVTISTTTTFGTKKAPASKSQFVADSSVVVIGQRSGETVAARRVIMAGAKAGRSGTTPSAVPTS